MTHDSKAAAYADRVLVIADGTIRDTIHLGRRESHDAAPLIARLAQLGPVGPWVHDVRVDPALACAACARASCGRP